MDICSEEGVPLRALAIALFKGDNNKVWWQPLMPSFR